MLIPLYYFRPASSSSPSHRPRLFCRFVPHQRRALVHLFILSDRMGKRPVIYSHHLPPFLYYLRSYYSSGGFECQIQRSLTDGSPVVG